MKRTVKRYHLKDKVKVLLLIIGLGLFTVWAVAFYTDRIERINNEEMTVQYNSER